MHIFRIFFVSTVLIPVLVVVATSDETGIRIRKPRNIVISEDGTRRERRLKPVNISDRNCPALGCTGNLTSNSFNGKGSLASELEEHTPSQRRFDTASSPTSPFHHHQPLKLEIRSIKNNFTLSDQVTSGLDNYEHSVGSSRMNVMSFSEMLSWAILWAYKASLLSIFIYAGRYCWNHLRKALGIGDDYIETYVKLGKDDGKHPFGSLSNNWPTFGVSLKTKLERKEPGWGWESHSAHDSHHHHSHHHGAYASSYHSHESQWPPAHYGGSEHYGWPMPSGWSGWKGGSKDDDDTGLRHKFDKKKGWKLAKKYTKKYGKKAHKYGLRPSRLSYMYDKKGNLVLENTGSNWAWRRR